RQPSWPRSGIATTRMKMSSTTKPSCWSCIGSLSHSPAALAGLYGRGHEGVAVGDDLHREKPTPALARVAQLLRLRFCSCRAFSLIGSEMSDHGAGCRGIALPLQRRPT